MGGIAQQHHAVVAPLARDPMVDPVQVGADNLDVRNVADEVQGLVAQLVDRVFGLPFLDRVEEAPTVRLTNQDHPFVGVAEIREIRVVARVLDIEIDLDVDQ